MSPRDVDELFDRLRAEPDRPSAWFALGSAALERGDLELSRKALLQAAHLMPGNDDAAVSVARMLADAGARTEAGLLLTGVLDRNSHRADAQLALARLQGAPAHAAALRKLKGTAGSPATMVGLHLLTARAHERGGDRERARAELAAAVALDHDHLEANRRLALVLEQLGDLPGCIRCWRRVVKATGGSDTQALGRLGIALSMDGQHAEALRILRTQAERPEAGAQACSDLATALLRADRADDAVPVLTRALAIDPRWAPAHCGLGLVRMRRGRTREAIEAFEATDRLAPDNPIGSFNLGLALWTVGNQEGARAALVRAASLAPADKEIRAALDELMTSPESTHGEGARNSVNPSLSGKLESLPTSELLEFLRRQGKRGTLVISSPRGMGIIRLSAGKVTSVSAPGLRRLGETLLARGLISLDGLEATLARRRHDPGREPEPLGGALLREGLVDERRLGNVLFEQVRTALAEMLRWDVGNFFFQNTEDTPWPLQFDLRELMMDLAHQPEQHTPVVRMLTPGPT